MCASARLTAVRTLAYAGGMLAQVAHRLMRIVLLVAVAMALVGTGFAHRTSADDDQRLAFILATGATAADVCDDATPGGDHHHAPCLACQIAGGALLPPAIGAGHDLALVPSAQIALAGESASIPRRLNHSRSPQAPPVL